jgi:two-component system, OmpR family, sensor histidine kinase ChvG
LTTTALVRTNLPETASDESSILSSGRPEPVGANPVELDDQLDQAGDAVANTAAPSRWLDRFSPGSLTARIALINLLGLIILTTGILYFNQFRQGLIDARVQSLMTQAQIIAGTLSGSATADTGNIVINPDSLNDTADEQSDATSGFDFPVNPETAGPILKRLLANTNIRARIIDPDGNLIVDSLYLSSGSEIIQSDLVSQRQPPGWLATMTNRTLDWMFGQSYPPYVEYKMDGNREHAEVAASLNGASVSVVRLNEERETIVLVSVPIQRFRAVLGSLVLSTQGGEIDRIIHAERQIVLYTFGFSSFVTLLLSGLLAGTIARPIRRLSAAAEQVRRGIARRVAIPDFTSRKDEIGDLSGSLRDMTQALYGRIDAIEAFAADVSHELKNPLTSLRSAVETLSFVKTDEQRSRLTEIVIHDVKRMDRLITDISDASRLDAELARTESKPVDLAKLVGAIVAMANETAKPGEAEVALTVQPQAGQAGPHSPYLVLGQDSRLSQVFRNLIDNARSFTAAGTRVTLRLRRVGDEVEARVEDAGPGIRPDNLERIFERFYTDRPEASFGKNSGLGLAITRRIVEAHKGRIWAENRSGKPVVPTTSETPILGARFILRLPALYAPDESGK